MKYGTHKSGRPTANKPRKFHWSTTSEMVPKVNAGQCVAQSNQKTITKIHRKPLSLSCVVVNFVRDEQESMVWILMIECDTPVLKLQSKVSNY